MKKILMKHTNILGIEMKYEAFYFGTITFKDQKLHLLSEHEKNINYDVSYALTDEDFSEHCKFIEPIQR